MDGAAVVPVLVDLEQQIALADLGLLPRDRDPERAEIAAAIGALLASRLASVTRDTRHERTADNGRHDQSNHHDRRSPDRVDDDPSKHR
jgi:hypothetical protein